MAGEGPGTFRMLESCLARSDACSGSRSPPRKTGSDCLSSVFRKMTERLLLTGPCDFLSFLNSYSCLRHLLSSRHHLPHEPLQCLFFLRSRCLEDALDLDCSLVPLFTAFRTALLSALDDLFRDERSQRKRTPAFESVQKGRSSQSGWSKSESG